MNRELDRLPGFKRLRHDDGEIRVLVLVFLHVTQVSSGAVLYTFYSQWSEQLERYDTRTGAQVFERQAIRGSEVRAFDCSVDFMALDVDQAIIFRAGGGAFGPLLFPVESDPDAAVGFAVAQQRDFFGGGIGHTKRLENIDQLVEALAVDESGEKSFARAIVNVIQGPQLAIVAQSFAEQVLVVAIVSACLACSSAASLHRYVRRLFHLLKSLVSKTKHEFSEGFSDTAFTGKELETIFLGLGRRG